MRLPVNVRITQLTRHSYNPNRPVFPAKCASAGYVFISREESVVLLCISNNHRACLREAHVLSKSFDALACLTKIFIIIRP